MSVKLTIKDKMLIKDHLGEYLLDVEAHAGSTTLSSIDRAWKWAEGTSINNIATAESVTPIAVQNSVHNIVSKLRLYTEVNK